MDLMDLFIKIEVKDNATSQIRQATDAAHGGTSAFTGFASAIGNGLKKAAEIGAAALEKVANAALSLAKYSANVGMDFEAQMSRVEAIAGVTADEMEAITEKAKQMGIETKYSATEAGQAMEYMAQAGWKASDIISGIEGVMDLAAASGENLASVSDIVTDALTAFGMAASDSAHFADVLAVAAAESNTDVAKMGQTFKYAAPIAGTLGYSIEDVAVAAGLMANSGIKASQAGTSLRSVLSRLASPTEQVKTAMEDLGISLTNSDGSSLSLMQLMEKLRDAFSSLSDTEQVAYASTIAAKTGMSGFLAIVTASDEEFYKLSQAIYNAEGAADKMATTMQDNLSGKVEVLKSSAEGFGLAVYEHMQLPLSRLAETGTQAIDSLTYALENGGLISVVSRASERLQNLALVRVNRIPQAAGAASSASEAFKIAIDGIGSSVAIIAPSIAHGLQKAADTLVIKVPEIMNGIAQKVKDNGPAVVSAALSIISTLVSALIASAPELIKTGGELLLQIVRGIEENLPKVTEIALSVLEKFAESTRNPENLHNLLDSAVAILTQLATFLIQSIPYLGEAAFSLITNFALYLKDPITLAKLAESASTIVFTLQQALIDLIGKIAEVGIRFATNLGEQFKNADWKGIGSQVVNAFLRGLQETWKTLVSWVESAIGAVVGMISSAIASVGAMIEQLKSAQATANGIADAVKGKVDETINAVASLGDKIKENTGFGDTFSSAVPDLQTFPRGDSGDSRTDNERNIGGTSISVTQNIYSEAQTAADLMQEASYEAEKAVIFA